MAGRLGFSQFVGNVKSVYTKGLSKRLAVLRSETVVPRYFGIDAFHQALSKFGIEKAFADHRATILLEKNNGRLIRMFAKECEDVPEFDRLHSPELIEGKLHKLTSTLNAIFGKKDIGLKVVLSNDTPDIYFLKEDANRALFKTIGSESVDDPKKEFRVMKCPKNISMVRFLRNKLPEKSSIDLLEHLKKCDNCCNKILDIQKLPSIELSIFASKENNAK